MHIPQAAKALSVFAVLLTLPTNTPSLRSAPLEMCGECSTKVPIFIGVATHKFSSSGDAAAAELQHDAVPTGALLGLSLEGEAGDHFDTGPAASAARESVLLSVMFEADTEAEDEADGEEEAASEYQCNRTPSGQWNEAGCHSAAHVNGCTTWHKSCTDEGDLLLLASVSGAARDGDGAAVKALVASNAKKLVVNRERRSIQMLDCVGGVVANIPVAAVLGAL